MTDLQVQDAPTATTSATGSNPTADFIWYELMTTDGDAATRFYEAVVGWKIQEGSPEYKGYRMIGRDDGGSAGGILPLTDEMLEGGAKPIWLGYLHVGDVDEKVSAIKQAGGTVHLPPTDIPNVGRIAMVADPQGAPFYVMKPIPPADKPDMRSDVFSRSAVQRCGWNELATTDEKSARQFYGEQFGWTSDNFMPMGEMGEYRFFDLQGEGIGAVFNTPEGRPRWRFYFRVPSISAAKEAVEKSGGTVATGPMQVPTGDWVLLGTDPQGAEFALVGGE
ncbi:MAG TPA: VOC family protein [Sphingomicrobium sp.]|nr:VOC family protein [Sphingomicrobium sp.]